MPQQTPARTVDSVAIQVLVDNSIEWFFPFPPPEFTAEVPYQLRNNPPIDAETDTPILDLENYCCGAHGLSLLITTQLGDEKHAILFDAGPESKSIARNASALKADLTTVERIVLSHWHSDHSGGILTAVQLIQDQRTAQAVSAHEPVIADLHPDRPGARGIWPLTQDKPICRLPADPTLREISSQGGRCELHAEPHAIAGDSMYISGKIARVTDFETGLVGGCQWIDGKWDNSVSNPGRMIMDERYLAIDVKDKGLIVFSACSHAGIVNVCKSALAAFGNARPLYAVIGGYHLGGTGMEERIPATVAYFAEEVSPKVKYVVPMHCSGFKAKTALRQALGDSVVPVGVGVKMVF